MVVACGEKGSWGRVRAGYRSGGPWSEGKSGQGQGEGGPPWWWPMVRRGVRAEQGWGKGGPLRWWPAVSSDRVWRGWGSLTVWVAPLWVQLAVGGGHGERLPWGSLFATPLMVWRRRWGVVKGRKSVRGKISARAKAVALLGLLPVKLS